MRLQREGTKVVDVAPKGSTKALWFIPDAAAMVRHHTREESCNREALSGVTLAKEKRNMYTPDNAWGTDLKREPQACKVRLARIYKQSGQSMMEIMNELKTLSDKDIEDFKAWFAAAGFPCTA